MQLEYSRAPDSGAGLAVLPAALGKGCGEGGMRKPSGHLWLGVLIAGEALGAVQTWSVLRAWWGPLGLGGHLWLGALVASGALAAGGGHSLAGGGAVPL